MAKQKSSKSKAPTKPERLNIAELSWQGRPPDIYCPVCGASADANAKPCDHVLLIAHEPGGLDYIQPRLQPLADGLEEEEGEGISELIEKIDSERAFFLSITTSGMACGPVSFETVVGFEFPTDKDKSD